MKTLRFRDALIAWTPAHYRESPLAGQILVTRLGHDIRVDQAGRHAMTGGAAYVKVRNMRGSEAVAQVFIDFHTIVVRDGLDPVTVHRAFLNIEEYRDRISPDIEGSTA
jgi:hypothetical protein